MIVFAFHYVQIPSWELGLIFKSISSFQFPNVNRAATNYFCKT